MQRFFAWADARRDLWLDCVRIYLGLGLFARGLLLITSTSPGYFVDLMQRSGQSWITNGILLHYVMVAHFVGGLLLTIGFLTRIAALVQIPVLFGAVFSFTSRTAYSPSDSRWSSPRSCSSCCACLP